MEQTYMKEKPILPLLLSMALPMVLSMMVNSLYNIIDSYFVAKINENAMTALSLVFPVQNLITAVGVGFGIGINATIAYFLGAQKQEEADTSATLGIACSFLHGVILTIGTITIMPAFLSMFTKEQEILSMEITYSRITFGFSVIISLGVAYEKIFQSVGRMKTTMFCMMSGCILNIILDPIMIFGLGPVPRMGIRGAAWATGLGQLLTLAAYLLFAWIRPLPVRISLKFLKFDLILLKKIYAVGIPATLNMALSSLLISSLNAILAVYGTDVCDDPWCLLQAPNLPVSSGKRDYPGNASADWIQLRCRRTKARTQTVFLYVISFCRNHAYRHPALHVYSGHFTRTLYYQPTDDHSRKYSTSNHQSRIYRIFRIHHFQWSTRRSWKRHTVADDLPLPLCDPDSATGISSEPPDWSVRCVACILDL